MVEVLETVKEFAVDLECSIDDVWLIQISTRNSDYIIDPIGLRSQIRSFLKIPLENPHILKVMHGSSNDVKWLYGAFGIRICNIFDTDEATGIVNLGSRSYIGIVEKLHQVILSRAYQRSDWSKRPLSMKQLMYARCDTHFLLGCYDRLLRRIQELGKMNEMEAFSKKICGKYCC